MGVGLMTAPLALRAATILVPADQPTIQSAINASTHGDEIIVSPGTYVENIHFNGKNITLRSTDPTSATVVLATIIDGNRAGTVVTFAGTETTSCTLTGFTITKGLADYGGGINGNHALSTIANNVITSNSAIEFPNSGITSSDEIDYGSESVNDAPIVNPQNRGGGLIFCDGDIKFNLITENSAYQLGGGLAHCNGAISSNTITLNTAQAGGGIYDCDGPITFNTISQCNKHGIHSCDGPISHNNIFENTDVGIYGCNGSIFDNQIKGNSEGGIEYCQSSITFNLIADNSGHGIRASAGLISNNTIQNNISYQGGGLYGCSGTITNNVISDNEAFSIAYSFPGYREDLGAGGGLAHCGGTISNNTIANNRSNSMGGGLYWCQGDIYGNIIRDNYVKPYFSESYIYGGGLYACSGEIHDNIIRGNVTTLNGVYIGGRGYGGGLSYCHGQIYNNQIIYNGASIDGGGLYECNATISGNIISNNGALEYGGGLSDCDGNIYNNIIANNLGFYCGGLNKCNGDIINNTIVGNYTLMQGYGAMQNCYGTVKNCIIWDNSYFPSLYYSLSKSQFSNLTKVSYSCIQDWRGGGEGNISSDPLMIDPANGDYRIVSDSPCVDAGASVVLNQDFEGDPRPIGSGIDIGADEFFAPVTTTPPSTPTNLDPINGDIVLSHPIDLTASPFSDPDPGDYQTAARWEIDDDPGFNSPEFTSGIKTTDLNDITVPDHIGFHPIVHYWRVRYYDKDYFASEWSDPTTYTMQVYIRLVQKDYTTIQEAIDASHAGDIIIVSPGTYFENINFKGKNIILRSTDPDDPEVVETTVIDGRSTGTVVTFKGNENALCTLSGFTITNGISGGGVFGHGSYNTTIGSFSTIKHNRIIGNVGSGIRSCHGEISFNYIYNNYSTYIGGGLRDCHGTISNNTITSNTAENEGGGIGNCEGQISSNVISNNRGMLYGGGGLYGCGGDIFGNIISGNKVNNVPGNINSARAGGLYYCDGRIYNNIISNNYAEGFGGGLVYCDSEIFNNIIVNNVAETMSGGGLSGCDGSIYNNIIAGNKAGKYGGGMYSCDGNIYNNTIYGNIAKERGGGVYFYSNALVNCIIWGNEAPIDSQMNEESYVLRKPKYCCIQDWTGGGTGIITSNPMLLDPENGDFHLSPFSSCIDAGGMVNLTNDFEGDQRPISAKPWGAGGDMKFYDIGADEFTSQLPYPTTFITH